MKSIGKPAFCGVLILVAALALNTQSSAQKKGKSRPLTTSQMMAGLVKPKYVALKTALEKGPKSDDEWEALTIDAALLNESGYLMMDDGRCPDKIWKDAANLLRSSTADLLSQLDQHDAAAATKTLESIQKSCKDCHTEHKYKKKGK